MMETLHDLQEARDEGLVFRTTGFRGSLSNLKSHCLVAGTLILAVAPLRWLWVTWTDPGYDSAGGFILLGLFALFLWSVMSPIQSDIAAKSPMPVFGILFVSTLLRLISQLLAVHVIGAAALVLDVYVIARLAMVDVRQRSLSPIFFSILFALTLPVERLLQRLTGYILQQASAVTACSILSAVESSTHCNGVLIEVSNISLLIDLPCSGARGLIINFILFLGLGAVYRPSFGMSAFGAVVTLAGAYGSNVVRVLLLVVGLTWSPVAERLSVMAPPWHDCVGLASLIPAFAVTLGWSRLIGRRFSSGASAPRVGLQGILRPYWCGRRGVFFGDLASRKAASLVLLFPVLAVGIVWLPASPVDVDRTPAALRLPSNLMGFVGKGLELSDQESLYFTLFGGEAMKASYGPAGLLVVSTSAPLRHLHAPDECLAGAGHEVTLHGRWNGALPGSRYSSIAPDGTRYQILVSFRSENGEQAFNVGEVVWRWLQHRDLRWMSVQRIFPDGLSEAWIMTFDQNLKAALEDV